MVTDRYQHLMHHETVDEPMVWAGSRAGSGGRRQHARIGTAGDRGPAARVRAAVRSGGPGVSDIAQRHADLTVSIAQFGSTRSINAGWPPDRDARGSGSTRT